MEPESFSSPFFSQTSSRLPDDTVFFSIFPDSSLSALGPESSASLQSLHLQIIDFVTPFTSPYIWQHEPFSLSISLSPSCPCADTPLPHLHGKLKYGDNLEDEWFAAFLLFRISAAFPSASLRVWDTDGEFLLIEAAFHLPRWLNPETSRNRVFLRGGDLHVVPRSRLPDPSLLDSLRFLLDRRGGEESRASDPVQTALKNRVSGYPEKAWRSMHRVRVRVPASVAHVLRHEPFLISLAVEGFYDRDVDSMKHAAKMDKFLSRGEELVLVLVKMSRAMYAQLVQQKFQAPSCYPMMPSVSDRVAYTEAEIGMKIACGMEMMYQARRKEGGKVGKGSGWSKYKENLEKNGYFEGLLCGSKEYKRLMESAEEYYQKSSSVSRTREIMSAPVRRIDEILAVPYSEDDFKGQEVAVSDDDSWLYDGEDELNSVLQERQKEMEFYNEKKERKHKGKEKEGGGGSSDANVNNFDLGDISKSMEQFIHKVSSYKGAEVPQNRDFKEVNLDVDRFMKDIESMLGSQGGQEEAEDDSDGSEGSSMDMDFEDDSEGEDPNDDDEKEAFMESYSGAMNEELKNSTLEKSFEHVNQPSSKQNGESSKASKEKEDDDDEFTPIDADFNLVKNLLESYSSQQGLPGPASNLLGLMGLQLPKDSKDD
ncbi:Protein SGT1-like protein [Raphanus sativus]|uniref:Protein ecdysoneless homolog n=1 Tax=Raphanus sativus TaxID=3726 RepID=A0A6J0P6C4_RAPSA|nr:protein ecdysoneless homolog [Raphanus sativus]KAJ4897189.1 Protein SGT1-like protein [Raphanus sativus]